MITFLLCLVFAIVRNVNISKGFNIDLSSAMVYHGEENSMFGYSVALHREHSRTWVISGAPKAKFVRYGTSVAGGAAYACDTTNSSNCEYIDINVSVPNLFLNKSEYDITDQWLGARVESMGEDGPLLICAPRLIHYYKSNSCGSECDQFVPIGMCYLVKNLLHPTVRTINPCGNFSRMGVVDTYCQAGFSTSLSKEGNHKYLYIGSPGHLGQPKARYIHAFNLLTLRERSIYVSKILDDAETSYFQYALVSFKFGLDDGIMAASIPRDADHLGKVIIFASTGSVVKKIIGEQMGAYFGYAMCSVDLNGDGEDDLIVSAPMYTMENSGNTETGRIYIYIQKQSTLSAPIKINGQGSRGRFGMSVMSLVDIDLDGYGDFAVGAPYDGPNNRGAVYIYRGTSNGASEHFSQVIYAESFSIPFLNTFGFSLHSGVDVDGNSHPDLVVGAYGSNIAILLRSRPAISLVATVNFSLKTIALDVNNCNFEFPCGYLESCILFKGKSVPSEIDLDITWSLDVEAKQEHRMFFLEQELLKHTINSLIHLRLGERACVFHDVYIHPEIQDKLSPIVAEMALSLRENYRKDYEPAWLSPVVNPSEERKRTTIKIWRNCGSDDICIPDLQLSIRTNASHVLGSSEPLAVNITILNKGEDAYESAFYMTFSDKLYFNKIQQSNSTAFTKVTCSAFVEETKNTVKCSIGNPFPKEQSINFIAILNPSGKYDSLPAYIIYFEVNSTNTEEETTKSDNVLIKSIEILVQIRPIIEGASFDTPLLYNASNFKSIKAAKQDRDLGPAFSQWYSIQNKGPTPIGHINIYFVWPYKTISGHYIVYLLDQPETIGKLTCSKGNANELHLGRNKPRGFLEDFSTKKQIPDVPNTETTMTMELIENQKIRELLRCVNFQCAFLTCTIPSLMKGEEVSLIVKTRLVVSTVKYLSRSSPIEFSNRFVSEIVQVPYFDNMTESYNVSYLELAYIAIEDRNTVDFGVPLWAYAFSASIGTSVFIMLMYSLYKCGFFKRNKIPKWN